MANESEEKHTLKPPLGLLDILHNVLSMLQFAESKNGALTLLNFTIVVGMGAAWNVGIFGNIWVKVYVSVLAVSLIASAILALSTFYPRTLLHKESGEWFDKEPTDLIYFGAIADCGIGGYAKELARYGLVSNPPNEIERSVVQQIIVNSRIAKKKFRIFKIAIGLSLLGWLTPPLALLFYWFFIDEHL